MLSSEDEMDYSEGEQWEDRNNTYVPTSRAIVRGLNVHSNHLKASDNVMTQHRYVKNKKLQSIPFAILIKRKLK